MTHGNGLSLALSAGASCLTWSGVAALTSHGISSAARRARANAEARGCGPGGSDGRPAPGRWQSAHLFGQNLSFGAARSAAAQLRTHSPGGAADRRWPPPPRPFLAWKLASPAGMSTWKSACPPGN